MLKALDIPHEDKFEVNAIEKTHGLRILQRVVFGTVVLGLIIALLGLSVKCLVKYFQEPTYTSTVIEPQQVAELPSMTVCVEDEPYKTEVLKV